VYFVCDILANVDEILGFWHSDTGSSNALQFIKNNAGSNYTVSRKSGPPTDGDNFVKA